MSIDGSGSVDVTGAINIVEPSIEEQNDRILAYERASWEDNCVAMSEAHELEQMYKATCLFRNFTRLRERSKILKQEVDDETECYMITFKPYDKNYDAEFKGMDHCRKELMKKKSIIDNYVLTREIEAKKIHYNAMVYTKGDLSELHNKCTNRYKIYCVNFPKRDRFLVWNYIFKEAKNRLFKRHIDYVEKK